MTVRASAPVNEIQRLARRHRPPTANRFALVDVLVDGRWHAGTGEVADRLAATTYRRKFPRAAVAADATWVTVVFDRPIRATPALRGRALLSTWFTTVTVAEFIGFAVPAAVGALTAAMSPGVAVPALLAAGAVEGAMLGSGQAAVMRRALPGLPGRLWIAATASAAVLAYAIGLTPSNLAIGTWPLPLTAVLGAIGGVVLLASIGTAQWLVLRRHVARAGRWIWATAVAWAAGLAVFLGFAMPLWQPGQSLWLIVGIGVVGGLLMAATTSLITGATLTRLLR